jgi:hypothetical protein
MVQTLEYLMWLQVWELVQHKKYDENESMDEWNKQRANNFSSYPFSIYPWNSRFIAFKKGWDRVVREQRMREEGEKKI